MSLLTSAEKQQQAEEARELSGKQQVIKAETEKFNLKVKLFKGLLECATQQRNELLSSDKVPASQQQASPPSLPADTAGSSTKKISFDLLVSNLSYNVTKPQLISIFEFFGSVDKITLHRDYEQHTTHAFILIRGCSTYSPLTAEINVNARKAVIRERHDIRNMPRKSRSIMLSSYSPPATFVFDHILEHFLDYGVVINITPFKVNKTRKGASYCFLKFRDYPSTEDAIANSPHRIGKAVFDAFLAKDF